MDSLWGLKMEKQYIYIVQAALEPSKCKIGKTNDYKRRLKEYNNMTGKSKDNIYRYLFVCEVKNMTKVENDFKKEYKRLREEDKKEILIEKDEKKEIVKIVKKTAPSLEERGVTQKDVMQKAKRVNNDEFYTRYEDIEKELSMYNKKFGEKRRYFATAMMRLMIAKKILPRFLCTL
jgi:predicted GIY-YIG superfamily endonuclease